MHAAFSNSCACCRERFHDWRKAASETTFVPPACLQYMVDLGRRLGADLACEDLMTKAAKSGSLEALKVIHEAGCKWTSGVPHVIAWSGDPAVLRYALDIAQPCSWDDIMDIAISSGNVECVKVLYDKGYEQLRRNESRCTHPAVWAIWQGQQEILRFVVDRSGPPPGIARYGDIAVRGGVEMLQYVRELGCVFDERTTEAAAEAGDVEALRYAHITGAPWNVRTLVAALEADSLPCLQYANMHGCPQEGVENFWSGRIQTRSLPILRYVSEHMDPAWAASLQENTARHIAHDMRSERQRKLVNREERLDWQLVQYLGRKLGAALPEPLAEAVAVRKERAVALAWVFRKAGLLCTEETRLLHREVAGGEENKEMTHVDAQKMALWEAMAKLPEELRRRIAVEAHLIML
jgi:hypothetical protein